MRKRKITLSKKIAVWTCIFSFTCSNFVWAQALPSGMIVTDGKTSTTITGNNISTSSIVGNNAFNSFSKFDVNSGTTVNLIVPDTANNLVNMVTGNGVSNISGTLNSLKNGDVGGNVFFFNPNGVMISKSGVVNVGSIMIATPSKSFINSVLSDVGNNKADGHIPDIFNGTMSVNESRTVTVQGRINAKNFVGIRTGTIDISNPDNVLAPTISISDIANTGDLTLYEYEYNEKQELTPVENKDIGIYIDGKSITIGDNVELEAVQDVASNPERGDVILNVDNNRNYLAAEKTREISIGDNVKLAGKDVKITNEAIGSLNTKSNVTIGDNFTIDGSEEITIYSFSASNLNAESKINIGNNADIKGKDITIKSVAYSAGDVRDKVNTSEDGTEVFVDPDAPNVISEESANYFVYFLDHFFNFFLPVKGIIEEILLASDAKGISEINIGNNAKLTATNDIAIKSEVITVTDMTTSITGAAVGIGINNNTSKIIIGESAIINATNDILMESKISSATLAEAEAAYYDHKGSNVGLPVNITFSLGLNNVENIIEVGKNSEVYAGNDLSILAENNMTTHVSASSDSEGQGLAAASVVISMVNGESIVNFNGKSATAGRNLAIESIVHNHNAATSLSSVGTGILKKTVGVGTALIAEKVGEIMGTIGGGPNNTGSSKIGLAGAINIAAQNILSQVNITDNATLNATGTLKINSYIHTANQMYSSSSVIGSEKDETKKGAISGALNYGPITSDAQVNIGDNVEILGDGGITITATTEMPEPYATTLGKFNDEDWDKIGDTIVSAVTGVTDILSAEFPFEEGDYYADSAFDKFAKVSDYFSNLPNLFTSLTMTYADAEEGSANVGNKSGFAAQGMLSYVDYNLKANINMGDNVSLKSTFAGGSAINVIKASTAANILDMAVIYAETKTASLGGSWLDTNIETEATVNIGDNFKGANLNDLTIGTDNEGIVVLLGGSATYGLAKGIGVAGTVSVLTQDIISKVTVGSGFNIYADILNVNANNDMLNIIADGGFMRSDSVGIGASVAINKITSDIGITLGKEDGAEGSIITRRANIVSNDDTMLVTAGIAGTIVQDSSTPIPTDPGDIPMDDFNGDELPDADDGEVDFDEENLAGGVGGNTFGVGFSGLVIVNDVDASLKTAIVNATIKAHYEANIKATSKFRTFGGSLSFAGNAKAGIALAGSAMVTLFDNDVESYLKDVEILKYDGVTDMADFAILATSDNQIGMDSASISGVIATKQSSFDGSLAGAVAYNEINNNVSAYADNLTSEDGANTGSLTISTDTKSIIYAFAQAISIAAGKSPVSAAGGAAVAINHIYGDNNAYLKNSDVAFNVIDIKAINDSEITTSSAGAIAAGTSGSTSVSIGASININKIDQGTNAYIDNSETTTKEKLSVASKSDDVIKSYGGQVQVAASSGVAVGAGASVVYSSIGNHANSYITNSVIKGNAQTITLDSDTIGIIETYLVSVGVQVSAEVAVGALANVAITTIDNQAKAFVENTGMDTAHAVITLDAKNDVETVSDGGVLDVAISEAGVALGANVFTVSDDSSVFAYIDNSKSSNNVINAKDLIIKTHNIHNSEAISIAGAVTSIFAGAASSVKIDVYGDNYAGTKGGKINLTNKLDVTSVDDVSIGRESVPIVTGALSAAIASASGSISLLTIKRNSLIEVADIYSSVKMLGGINIAATTNHNIYATLVPVAINVGGLGVGIGVNKIESDTEVYFGANKDDVGNVNVNTGSLNVKADNNSLIKSEIVDVAVVIGGGIGSAIDVTTINNSSVAKISGNNSSIIADTIDVNAKNTRNINNLSVGGTGGLVTYQGSFSFVQIGNNATEDIFAQDGKTGINTDTQGKIDDQIDIIKGLGEGGNMDDDVKDTTITTNKTTATTASIEGNVDINTKDLSVLAEDIVKMGNQIGGISVGLLGGLGSSSSSVNLSTDTKSFMDNDGDIYITDTVEVESSLNYNDIAVEVWGGTGGIVALGAAVNKFVQNASQQAYINGNILTAKGINIDATANGNVDLDVLQFGIGGIVLGGSVLKYDKNNNMIAYMDGNVGHAELKSKNISDIDPNNPKELIKEEVNYYEYHYVDYLNVNASNTVTTDLHNEGGAAGIIGASGGVINNDIKDKIVSEIRGNNTLYVKNAVSVLTGDISDLTLYAEGYDFGGLNIGANVIYSDIIKTNNVNIGENVHIIGQTSNLDVSFHATQGKSKIDATAEAAIGTLIGGTGSAVYSNLSGEVKTNVASGLVAKTIADANIKSLTIRGSADSNVTTYATGKGFIGMGAGVVKSESDVNLDTKASMSGLYDIKTNTFNMYSNNETTTNTKGLLGLGGLLDVEDSYIKNFIDNDTEVLVEGGTGGTLVTDVLNMHSNAVMNQDYFFDSTNVSLIFGYSGVEIINLATSDNRVNFYGNNDISYKKGKIYGSSTYKKGQDGSRSYNGGAGGLVGVGESFVFTDAIYDTMVYIGDGTKIVNTENGVNDDYLFIGSLSNVFITDKLDHYIGGVIGGDQLESYINKRGGKNHTKVIFDGATVMAGNDLNIISKAASELVTDLNVSFYGLEGTVLGRAYTDSNISNLIQLSNSANVTSLKDIGVYLGSHDIGFLSDIGIHEDNAEYKIDVSSYTVNGTALPFGTSPKAFGNLDVINKLDVGTGSNLIAFGDVFIDSDNPYYTLLAKAVFKNTYSAMFGLDVISGETTLGINSSVNVDGTIQAGAGSYLKYDISQKSNGEVVLMVTKYGIANDGTLQLITTQDTNNSHYDTVTGNASELFLDRYNELLNLITTYKDTSAYSFYEAELNELIAQMKIFGVIQGDSTEYYVVTDKQFNYVKLHDIYSSAGQISILSKDVTGSGLIGTAAGSDVEITSSIHDTLLINNIEIANNSHSGVYFNYLKLTGASDLKNFKGKVTSTGVAGADVVNIANNNASSVLELEGQILNLNGLVDIYSKGSIIANANIRANTVKMDTDGAIVQHIDSMFSFVGGEVQGRDNLNAYLEAGGRDESLIQGYLNSGEKSSITAAGDIFITANYLVINGLIQSGVEKYSLTINDGFKVMYNGHAISLAEARNHYNADHNNYLFELEHHNSHTLSAYFNFKTGKIETGEVGTTGGHVHITGYILNTGKDTGEIKALAGHNGVEITNNSSYDLVLKNIDVSEQGEGVISITDLNKTDSHGNAITTTYTHSSSGHITVSSQGSSHDVSGNSTSYTPKNDSSYVWETGTTSIEKTTDVYESKKWLGIDWAWKDEDRVSTETINIHSEPILSGERYLTFNLDYDYEHEKHPTTDKELVSNHTTSHSGGFLNLGTVYVTTKIWHQGEKEVKTFYAKADYPIKISFFGSSDANITVNSNHSVLLDGIIKNLSGTTSISTQNSIYVEDDYSEIISKNINLSAVHGIGSMANALIVDATSGALNVHNTGSSGDINLANTFVTNDFTWTKIQNDGGNVKITAVGDINSSHVVKGNSIELVSINGGIGSESNHIQLDTKSGDIFKDDNTTMSWVSASASGNIYLKENSGNLGINSVITNGDVSVKADSGAIYDANAINHNDPDELTKLQEKWARLGLSTLTQAQIDEKVATYKATKEAEYRTYWHIKNDAEFAKNFSADDIAKLTAAYEGFGNTYDKDFSYTVSDTEIAALSSDNYWTENQLKYSIKQGLGGTYGNEKENIIAKNVKLESRDGVGAFGGIVDITVSDTMSDADLLLLSNAEYDSLTFSADGKTIEVAKREDLDVTADSITIDTAQHLYLGSAQDINIDNFDADSGDITLHAQGGVYDVKASGNTNPNITGGNLNISTTYGDVGTIDKPISINLIENAMLNVTTSKSINIASEGDKAINIGFISAKKDANLVFAGDILDGLSDTTSNFVIDGDLTLDTTQNIGTGTSSLDFNVTGSSEIISDKDAYLNFNNITPAILGDIEAMNLYISAPYSVLISDDNAIVKAANNLTFGTMEGLQSLAAVAGSEDDPFKIDVGGKVKGTLSGNSYLASDASIDFEGLIAATLVVNAVDAINGSLSANDLNLFANELGTQVSPLTVDVTNNINGYITGTGYLHSTAVLNLGDLSGNALHISADENINIIGEFGGNDIFLTTTKDILDVNDNGITARNLTVEAVNLGESANPLNLYISGLLAGTITGNGYLHGVGDIGIGDLSGVNFDIYSDNEIHLKGTLTATENISLHAKNNIFNYSVSALANIEAKNLIKKTDEGNIGSIGKLVTFTLAEDGIFNAEAGKGIYADSLSDKNVNIGLVEAKENSVLGFAGKISDNNADTSANFIMAKGLVLKTSDDIGSATSSMDFDVQGEISVDTNNDAFINFANTTGHVFVNEIKANNLSLSSPNMLLLGTDGDGITTTNDLTFGTVENGASLDITVGTLENPLKLNNIGGKVKGELKGQSFLFANNSLTFEAFVGDDLRIEVGDNIHGDITSRILSLFANNLGTSTEALEITVSESINGYVTGTGYIHSPALAFRLGDFVLNKLDLNSDKNVYIVGEFGGNDISLTSSGDIIGDSDHAITARNLTVDAVNLGVDKDNPLYVHIVGILQGTITGNGYLYGVGDIGIGDLTGANFDIYSEDNVNLKGTITASVITMEGANIFDETADNSAKIAGDDVDLIAHSGDIGSEASRIDAEVNAGGSFIAWAYRHIWLKHSNDLYVESLISKTGNVNIDSEGSIFAKTGTGNPEGVSVNDTDLPHHIQADNIILKSQGKIGLKDDRLIMYIYDPHGYIDLYGKDDIFVHKNGQYFHSHYISSEGEVNIQMKKGPAFIRTVHSGTNKVHINFASVAHDDVVYIENEDIEYVMTNHQHIREIPNHIGKGIPFFDANVFKESKEEYQESLVPEL